MKKFKTIIIDDEPLAREQIRSLLDDYADFEVIKECSNGLEGYHAIKKDHPDLVFLDVQMPKVNGFEMLELLEKMPVVIFSTAYDEYALRAFEVHAVDYLLKPFSRKRFEKALEQARRRLQTEEQGMDASQLHEAYQQEQSLNRLVVKKSGKIIIVPVKEVVFFEATGDYVAIHTAREKFLKHQTMKYFEDHLGGDDFIRVHRSYIVNLNYVLRLEPYTKDSYVVVMKNEERVYVSRPGMKKLKESLSLD